MQDASWFILVYETPDADAQRLLANRLRAMGGLIVQTAANDGEYVVAIESTGAVDAITLHELVMTLEAHAELVSTHKGTIEEPDLDPLPRQRLRARRSGYHFDGL